MRFSKCKSTPFRYPSASSCPETPLLANLERTPIKRMADCCGARLYRIKSAPRNSRSSNLVSKSTFLARNYASLPPIFESQLRNPPTSSPLPAKQCFIRDNSNINAVDIGATQFTKFSATTIVSPYSSQKTYNIQNNLSLPRSKLT